MLINSHLIAQVVPGVFIGDKASISCIPFLRLKVRSSCLFCKTPSAGDITSATWWTLRRGAMKVMINIISWKFWEHIEHSLSRYYSYQLLPCYLPFYNDLRDLMWLIRDQGKMTWPVLQRNTPEPSHSRSARVIKNCLALGWKLYLNLTPKKDTRLVASSRARLLSHLTCLMLCF